jgi:hypothetical protein
VQEGAAASHRKTSLSLVTARVFPASTPHQLTSVGVSTHPEWPPALCAGRATAADTGSASGAVKGSAAGARLSVVMESNIALWSYRT